jgi:hypothetical protein
MNELGILPMAETRKLHGQILTDDPLPPEGSADRSRDQKLPLPSVFLPATENGAPNPTDLQQIFHHTASAMSKLEETRRDINNVYDLLQGLLPRAE